MHDRQRDMIFKYDKENPIQVDKTAKDSIKFHQKRRNTLSRDRVPTRKGGSRARRKRFNAFTKQSGNSTAYDEFGSRVYGDHGPINIQR